ncbi:hypothetical protein KAR34_04120 [bacterium]|nr:hypothetical protein [bacterium]
MKKRGRYAREFKIEAVSMLNERKKLGAGAGVRMFEQTFAFHSFFSNIH